MQFLRSEAILDRFGVDEYSFRDADGSQPD
jgi:hypothetical protein